MTVNQRRHQRYVVEIAAEVELEGQVLVAATQNVSRGGVGLVLDCQLTEGASIRLRLFLTQDGIEDPDEEPFSAKATVVWCAEQEGGSFTCGTRFGTLPSAQSTLLARFVEALAQD